MSADDEAPGDTPIGDYGFIADMRSGALVAPHGGIDWLCLPRYDSPAVFSALLGDAHDGRWLVQVDDATVEARRYLDDAMALESRWSAPGGTAVSTDWMPIDGDRSEVVRTVTCTEGEVTVTHELVIRFDYGEILPWLHKVTLGEEQSATTTVEDGGESVLHAVAGPSSLVLHGPLPSPADDGFAHRRQHTLRAGESLTWVLEHQDSWRPVQPVIDLAAAWADTEEAWRAFADKITAHGEWAEQIRRSLLVLRSLSHIETGGIVAAATASLPEDLGGERNWDYRYCWLRDAALTLEALIAHGFVDDAKTWRDWLLRAVAGCSDDLLIMYGLGGERRLPERELPHLRGYGDSRPVRVGNGAVDQYQADVVGEVMLALAQLRDAGWEEDRFSWGLQRSMLSFQEQHLDDLDHGIWEMRGELHHFTHGRVMMWAAFDQGVRAVEEHGLDGPVERWRELRDRLRAEVEEHGIGDDGGFRQTYDGDEVDASLLQIPQAGFCAYDDERMLATVARLEEELVDGAGFVHRYRTEGGMDGLAGDESPFLICSFWLVEQYAHSGRLDEARELMDRVVGTTGELGLMAEEYDPGSQQMLGNFPQAFSHLGLVRAADAIAVATGDLDTQEWAGRYGTAARCSGGR